MDLNVRAHRWLALLLPLILYAGANAGCNEAPVKKRPPKASSTPAQAGAVDARAVPARTVTEPHTTCRQPTSLKAPATRMSPALQPWKHRALIRAADGHRDEIIAAGFSPEGDRLATGDRGGQILVWESQTGKLLHRVQGPPQGMRAPAFHPDGRNVVVGGISDRNLTAELWTFDLSRPGWRPLKTSDDTGYALQLRVTPDGRFVVLMHVHGLQVYSWKPWKLVANKVIDDYSATFFEIAGQHVLLHQGSKRTVLRLKTLRALRRSKITPKGPPPKNDTTVYRLKLDGKVYRVVVTDNSVRRLGGQKLERREWTAKETFESHELLRAAGLLAVVAGDKVTVIDLRNFRKRTLPAPLPPNDDASSVTLWSAPTAPILVAARGAAMRIWRADTGRLIRRVNPTEGWLSLAFDRRRGNLLGGSNRGRVVLWNPTTGKMLRKYAPGGKVTSVAFASSGETYAAANGKQALVWEAAAGKRLARFAQSDVTSVSLCPDGGLLATNSGQGVPLCDVHRGTCNRRLPGNHFHAVAISPDGARVAACQYGGPARGYVAFWDTQKGGAAQVVPQSDIMSWSLAFLPSSRRVVVGGPMSPYIRVVSTKPKTKSPRLQYDEEWPRALAVSPDGKILAVGGPYGGINLFQLPSRKALRTLRARRAGIRALAFSPDGTHLAVADDQGNIELWRLGAPR